jgi:hypothetical protein
MKRIKYIAIGSLSLAALLLGMSACSNLDDFASGDGEFAFAASQSAVTVSTRAGSAEQFDQNTRYYLYALVGTDWSKNYLSSTDPTSGSYIVGTESSNHTIDYTGSNKFNGQTVNFYGITENKQDEPTAHPTNTLTITESGTSAPTVSAQYPTTTDTHGLKVLPDYMWANLNGQTYKNAGTITLPFIHTTSLLKFLVVEDNESTTTSQNLAVTKIELCDYASGTLNMSTGKFESTSETRTSNWYPVYSGSQTLTTTSTTLKFSDKSNVETTIFPTRGTDLSTHSLGIKVTLSNGNSYTYWTREPNLDSNNQVVSGTPYKAFNFEPNYQYDVQLTITAKDMVVTILPRYYGWISTTETQDNLNIQEIGNPVTFGGVVWMDRNLGATSANPTASAMDWERSVGWFYQFGRSIPYYIKGSIQDPEHINDTSLSTSNVPQVSQSSWNMLNKGIGKPYPYVFGYYHTQVSDTYPVALNGWDNDAGYVYNMANSYSNRPTRVSTDRTIYAASKLAKKPGDTGKYNFVVDLTDGNSYPKVPYDWDYDHTTSATTWQTAASGVNPPVNLPANQPCPKGWRLPTVNECLTIYPYDATCGDICFASEIGSYIIGQTNATHNTDHRADGGITYYYPNNHNQGGVYKAGYYIDYLNKDGQYVGIKEFSGDTYATIYCIKKQGTDKAYRIKWSVVNVTKGSYGFSRTRQVLKIERFPATSTTSIVNV